MNSRPNNLPPWVILGGMAILFAVPFLLVQLFPAQLDTVFQKSSYLVFHSVAEFFSIMVSLSIFGVGWYSYEQSRDRQALFLAAAFLAVGLIDFMHTMSNAGMPEFISPNSTNKSTQLWITARLLDAAALLVSAFIHPETEHRLLTKRVLMTCSLTITALVFTGVTFFPDLLPATAMPGTGLTPLKRWLELLVILLLVAALCAYWRRSVSREQPSLLFPAALIICIFGEAVFASYRHGFDTYNVLGHIYKVLAFFLIYKSVFIATINRPYLNLSRANAQLREEVAERIRAETESRQKDRLMLQQNRLAAMGEMIHNIAHQWRQPLNTIGLIIQQLDLCARAGLLTPEQVSSSTSEGMKLILHMSQTIEDFRNFFRPDKEKSTFRVETAINQTVSLVLDSLKNNHIGIELDACCETTICGYPNEFCQALLNIVHNARDAILEREIPEGRIRISAGSAEGRNIITISDNAGGIPDEIIERIFEPYFSTKGLQGTGIGLFMTKNIIENSMGGRLTAVNTADGAEFRIEI